MTKENKKEKKWGIAKSKTEILPEILAIIMAENRFLYDKNKSLWRYDSIAGVWREDGEEYVNTFIRRHIESEESQRIWVVSEVISAVKGHAYTGEKFPDADPRFIPFLNCVYDLQTKKIIEFSPEQYLKIKLPVTLTEKFKKCEKIDRTIREWVSDEDVKRLYQLMAYCLYRGYPIQRFFILYGGGNNGKSQFLGLLEKFIGEENVSNESLNDIIKTPFSAGNLWNKLINSTGEMLYSVLNDTDKLKKLTGGDGLMCNRKQRQAFPFKNYAKLLFNTNEIPKTNDRTTAFFRRVSIIKFANEFVGERDNKKLLEEITTPAELSGLAWTLVSVLQELYDNSWDFLDKSLDETKTEYEELSNPILNAVDEAFDRDYNGGFVYACDVFSIVNDFCRRHKLQPRDSKSIKNVLIQEGIEHRIKGEKKLAAYVGIVWKRVEEVEDVEGVLLNPYIYKGISKSASTPSTPSTETNTPPTSDILSENPENEQTTPQKPLLPTSETHQPNNNYISIPQDTLEKNDEKHPQTTPKIPSKLPLNYILPQIAVTNDTRNLLFSIKINERTNGAGGVNAITNWLTSKNGISEENARGLIEKLIAAKFLEEKSNCLFLTKKANYLLSGGGGQDV